MEFFSGEALMERGQVKWFDARRGFGFIVDGAGREVFVHYRAIEGERFRRLADGEEVVFASDEREKGRFAVCVRRIRSGPSESAVC